MVVNNTQQIVRAIVNSSARLDGTYAVPVQETSTNFTIQFSKEILRVSEIIIESVQIPYSFYAINANNNSLTFNSTAISITIPPGNYTTATLTGILTSLINTAFNDNTTVVIFNYSTFTLTIKRGTAFSIDGISEIFGTYSGTATYILGFGNVTTPMATSATGTSVINISGPNYLQLTSKYLASRIKYPTLNNLEYDNVLISIPVNASPGDTITLGENQQFSSKFGFKFNIPAFTPIDFQIIGDANTGSGIITDNSINLNGAEISISLIFITE